MTPEESLKIITAFVEAGEKAMEGAWTFSPMVGTEGHCFAAQVWADGRSLVVVDDWPGEEQASAVASMIASSRSIPAALRVLAREVRYLIEVDDDLFCLCKHLGGRCRKCRTEAFLTGTAALADGGDGHA